jgi:hypothetical protein
MLCPPLDMVNYAFTDQFLAAGFLTVPLDLKFIEQ